MDILFLSINEFSDSTVHTHRFFLHLILINVRTYIFVFHKNIKDAKYISTCQNILNLISINLNVVFAAFLNRYLASRGELFCCTLIIRSSHDMPPE